MLFLSKAKVANNYFDFKQFRVNQSHAAMKVTTEGCILGAWTAALGLSPKRILDIGSGTGLLSLMLAQQCTDAKIDAVELDQNAAVDARQNFELSPWLDRLNLIQKPIQEFVPQREYDLIISNPPFYKSSLKSPSYSINHARHDDTLSQIDLVNVVLECLSDSGTCAVLYPEREMNQFISLGHERGLFLNRRLNIYNHNQSSVFRVIGLFSTIVKTEIIEEKLLIRNSKNEYTRDFTNLLKEYYLHL